MSLKMVLMAATAALGLAGGVYGGGVLAQVRPLAMLDRLEPGDWELRKQMWRGTPAPSRSRSSQSPGSRRSSMASDRPCATTPLAYAPAARPKAHVATVRTFLADMREMNS